MAKGEPKHTPDLFSVNVKDINLYNCINKYKELLTACVFESVDGIGQEADTAQETCALLFVDLLVVPYTDGYGV